MKKTFQFSSKFLIFSSIFVFLPAIAYGGGTAGAFLDLGVGAKGSGLGGAFSAAAGEVSCVYYNPSGLSWMNRMALLVSHKSLSLGREQNAIGYARKLGPRTGFGIMWVEAGTDLDRRDINGERTGTLRNSENALIFSFAKGIGGRISLGLSGKYIWKELAEQRASGLGFDFSASLRVSDSFNLSAQLRNLIPTEISWRNGFWERDSSRDERLPSTLSCGFQYSMFEGRMNIFGDISEDDTGGFQASFGSDLRVSSSLFLRAGIKDLMEGRHLSLGATFELPQPFEEFDIGYALFGDAIDAGYGHEFSLQFRP